MSDRTFYYLNDTNLHKELAYDWKQSGASSELVISLINKLIALSEQVKIDVRVYDVELNHNNEVKIYGYYDNGNEEVEYVLTILPDRKWR